MSRKRVFVGFGGHCATYKERPTTTFRRAITAAWWSFLLFWVGVGEVLSQDPNKHHVAIYNHFFRGFVAAVTVVGAWYVLQHPVWIWPLLAVWFCIVAIGEALTPGLS